MKKKKISDFILESEKKSCGKETNIHPKDSIYAFRWDYTDKKEKSQKENENKTK